MKQEPIKVRIMIELTPEHYARLIIIEGEAGDMSIRDIVEIPVLAFDKLRHFLTQYEVVGLYQNDTPKPARLTWFRHAVNEATKKYKGGGGPMKAIGGHFHLETTQAVDPDDPNFRIIDEVQVVVRYNPDDLTTPFSVGARNSELDSFHCMHYRMTLWEVMEKCIELLNERRKARGWRVL